MNKLKTKIAYFLMVIFTCSLVFAGCSNEAKSSGGATSATEAKQTTAATEVKAEPVKVLWYLGGTKPEGMDEVIADLNKKLIDKINVTLDLQIIDFGAMNDKMKMIVASSEEYDLTYTANWVNLFSNNVAQGAFAELDELIDKNAPKLRTELPKSLLDVARVNGKLYAVPNYQMIYNSYGVFVQKNLLDKYGFDLEKVQKIQDLEPFLETIKKSEPGLIPMQSGLPYPQLDNSYEALNGYAGIKTDDNSFKVFSLRETVTKQEHEFMRDFLNKGFYRKDLMTVTDDSADVKANRYAVLYGSCKPGGDIEMSAKQNMEYKMKALQVPYIASTAGLATMTAVSVTSKHPDSAIKLVELMNTDKDIFNELLYGLENVNYKKLPDNTVEPVEGSKYNLYTMAWAIGNQFNAWYMKGQTPGIWEETRKLNETSKVSPVRGFTFDPTPVADVIAKVDAVSGEYSKIPFMKNYEEKFAEYLEKAKAAGLQQILDETQKQLDAWAAANGKK
jgi:putative aldouronate transport system substrate-binding protein